MLRLSLAIALLAAACSSDVTPDASTDAAATDHPTLPSTDASPDITSTAIHTCGANMMNMGSYDWFAFGPAEGTCSGNQPCRLCVQRVSGDTVGPWQFFRDSNCVCPSPEITAPSAATQCTATTTFAIPTRAEADALCAGESDCLVCVEREDAGGPNLWSVTRHGAGCTCPPETGM